MLSKLMKNGVAVAMIATLAGCGDSEPTANIAEKPQIEIKNSATKNSFQEVVSKLDAGGNSLVYLSTEEVIEKVKGFAINTEKAFSEKLKGRDKEQVMNIIEIIKNLVKTSGITEVSGFGLSSIKTTKENYRTRIVLHHYKNQGKGVLWNLMADKSRKLVEADFIPNDVAFATFTDINLPLLEKWILDNTNKGKFAELNQKVSEGKNMLRKTQNIDVDKITNSVTGFGLILTLDKEKKATIPMGRKVIEIAEPALAVVLKVKDDTIYNLLDSKIPPMFTRADKDGVKTMTMAVSPMPFLSPIVIQKDGYLIIASSNKLVDKMFAAKQVKNGFVYSEKFKKIGKDIKFEGTSMEIITPAFTKFLFSFINDVPEEAKEFINKIKDLYKNEYAVAVATKTAEGYEFTYNTSYDMTATVILAPTVAVSAILPAMLLPSTSGFINSAKSLSCTNNLKRISLDIKSYELENGTKPKNLFIVKNKRIINFKDLTCPLNNTKYNYTPNGDELISCDHGKLGRNVLYKDGSVRLEK